MRDMWVVVFIHTLKASKPNTNIYKLSRLAKDIIEERERAQEQSVHRASESPAEFSILVTANNLPVMYSRSRKRPHSLPAAAAAAQRLCGQCGVLFMLCCYRSHLQLSD